ncbi:MAG: DUF1841 family protein [Nitrospiria bacterium]
MDVLFSNDALVEYAGIWTQLKQGAELSDEAEEVAKVLREHPEFDPFWGQGGAALQPQEIEGYIVNPLIHTRLHVIIERQIFEQNPEEVKDVFRVLLDHGTSRHEAIHQIAGLWGDLYFRSIRQGSFFDEYGYVEALKGLCSFS